MTEVAKNNVTVGNNNNSDINNNNIVADDNNQIMLPSNKLKIEGNEALKNEKYEEAITFYTNAIGLLKQNLNNDDSKNNNNNMNKNMAILLSNRSTALIKMKEYEKGKIDATNSITFNKMYFKAYWRLSDCEQNLGNFNTALDVLYQCLDLDKGLYGDPKLKEQFSYTRKLKCKLYNKFPQIHIEKYAFSDGRKKVSAYIDLPGISKVRKEDILMKCESKSMDLRIHGIDNKCYRLYAPELWQRIIPEKCKFKIKAEKDQLVVILAKVGTQDIHSTWEHLRRQ